MFASLGRPTRVVGGKSTGAGKALAAMTDPSRRRRAPSAIAIILKRAAA
jgi:hypothetical protein